LPTLDHIRDYFAGELNDPHCITLKVNFNNDLSLEDLIKIVKDKIQTKREVLKHSLTHEQNVHKHYREGYLVFWRTVYLPSTKIKKELNDYDDIWDNQEKYRKKLRASKVYYNTYATTFYKKLRKAKKIIENVERGIFPGDYAD
jgi:hypothetical protein